MIEQPADDPYPEHTVFVEVVEDTAFCYIAGIDIEATEFTAAQLLDLKLDATGAVKKQCGEVLLSGFDSDASGETLHYNSTIEDQLNLISANACGFGMPSNGLTQQQVLVLNRDMSDRVEDVLAEKESRLSEVNLAEDQASLEAVVNRIWE